MIDKKLRLIEKENNLFIFICLSKIKSYLLRSCEYSLENIDGRLLVLRPGPAHRPRRHRARAGEGGRRQARRAREGRTARREGGAGGREARVGVERRRRLRAGVGRRGRFSLLEAQEAEGRCLGEDGVGAGVVLGVVRGRFARLLVLLVLDL